MIENSSIEQLKQVVNIVDIVSNYIELRKTGANYTACCPFHDEKTSSFVVSPQKGYFKCFGCGVGGDSISFIMQKENIGFYEAVEKLANMCNFQLIYTKIKTDSGFYDILEKITQYYQDKLNSNIEISKYLEKRGITNQSIKKFRIGWSGDSYEFISFLNEKKIPFDKLQELGVINRGDRGFYAKFNKRIMFPIFTPNNKIIGFGGRGLNNDIAKYINSQQSKIFNKSQILYGYNLAKDSIFKEKKIIITEGYIDTIMMSQGNFTNCVATLGTALTKEHLPLLAKGDPEILLCYDGDNAGINAAFKASLLLSNKSGGVVIFQNGKDPADMIAENKSSELIELLKSPTPFIEFIIQRIVNKFDINNPLKKEKALKEILDFFKTLSPLLQDEYSLYASSLLKVSPHFLNFRGNNKKIKNKNLQIQNIQLAEDVIIKSILENKKLLDLSLEYLNANVFKMNKDKFNCLLCDDFENKDLLGILINQSIIKLDEKEFKEQIRLFIISIYTNKLNEVKQDKKLKFDKKMTILKDIRNKLKLLRSGILVKVDYI